MSTSTLITKMQQRIDEMQKQSNRLDSTIADTKQLIIEAKQLNETITDNSEPTYNSSDTLIEITNYETGRYAAHCSNCSWMKIADPDDMITAVDVRAAMRKHINETQHAVLLECCTTTMYKPETKVNINAEKSINEKTIPFIAVGYDEFDESVPKYAKELPCPNCGDNHTVEYGKDESGKVSKWLGFVKCPKNNTPYLVTINGSALPAKVYKK